MKLLLMKLLLMKLPGIIAGVNSSQTKAGLDRPISLVVVGEIGAHKTGISGSGSPVGATP
jgi:hypothetical protein